MDNIQKPNPIPQQHRVTFLKPEMIFISLRTRGYFYGEDTKSASGISYLNYIRSAYYGYDLEKGDILDEQLLTKLSALSSECSLFIKQLLIFEDHRQQLERMAAGNRQQTVIVNLFPLIDYGKILDLVGSTFTSMTIELKANVRIGDVTADTMKKLFPEYITLDIPHDRVRQLANSIIPV